MPPSPNPKLSNFQTFKLSNLQTFKLSNFQTFKLSNFQKVRPRNPKISKSRRSPKILPIGGLRARWNPQNTSKMRGLNVKNHKFQKKHKKIRKKHSWSYLREEIWPDRKTVAKTMQKPAVLKCAKKKNLGNSNHRSKFSK